jgi:hypothetical protein
VDEEKRVPRWVFLLMIVGLALALMLIEGVLQWLLPMR